MHNLISVTQTGKLPEFLNNRIREAPGNIGKGRFAGDALKHPALIAFTDFLFPQSVAPGTLTEVIKKHGYEAAPSLVFTNAPETYKYEYKPDPETDAALTRQKSHMDGGVSGTFMPGSLSGMR